MKTSRFHTIVIPSIFHNKGRSISFGIFVIICTTLVISTISILIPLQENMENKINNHILNRELIIHFEPNKVDEGLKEAKKLQHLSDIYLRPYTASVMETSGVLHSNYEFSFVHNGYTPIITSGRMIKDNEENAAIIPETIKDYNDAENRINTIDGKTLVGKNLIFKDDYETSYKIKIVGTYNTVDPMFSGKQVLISKQQLISINKAQKENPNYVVFNENPKVDYVLVADNYKNKDALEQAANDIAITYTEDRLNFNTETFNTALLIITGGCILLIIMAFTGAATFISASLKSRQCELALYRSFGYKGNHLFRIIFLEFLYLCIPAVVIGTILSALANVFIINPYLFDLLGNTIMEIKAKISILYAIGITIVFIFILLISCSWSVRKSSKTDLMILIK